MQSFMFNSRKNHRLKIQQESRFVCLHSGWLIELLAGEQHIIGKVSSQQTNLKESHPKSKPGTRPVASLQTHCLYHTSSPVPCYMQRITGFVPTKPTKTSDISFFGKGVQVDAKLIFRAHGVFYTQKNCSPLNSTKLRRPRVCSLNCLLKGGWYLSLSNEKRTAGLKWVKSDAELHWSFQKVVTILIFTHPNKILHLTATVT